MAIDSFTPLTPLAFLERSADVFADKTAIAYGDRRLSYREFGAEASQKRTAFFKPKRALARTKSSRKEPTAPRSMHERDEKLVLDF